MSSAAGEEGGAAERGRFPAWQPGVDYAAGDHVCFRGKDYAVQQGHRSQVRSPPSLPPSLPTRAREKLTLWLAACARVGQGDWTPDSTPNLFGAMEGASKGPLEKE